MASTPSHNLFSSTVVGVFEKYLATLAESGFAKSKVLRLQAVLLSGKPITEKALAEALLSDESLP
jgi:hypothetical protein